MSAVSVYPLSIKNILATQANSCYSFSANTLSGAAKLPGHSMPHYRAELTDAKLKIPINHYFVCCQR
ncbi:hypothetical protein [Pseudoalteromonas 'SMAR']|uniref:hypothetical protein n=1 Tax=Pseudoalteromonas 'SMAR' TaxID=3416908 RepID=UPI003AF2A734